MTMAAKTIDVPEGLFSADDEAPTQRRRRAPEKNVEQTPLEKFLGRKRDPDTGKLIPKKRSSRTVASSSFSRTLAETREMLETRDWSDCASRHLVALFELMHEKTYGIAPTMSGSDRYKATMFAGNFVKRAFDGDMQKTIAYLRWVWTREIDREKWRRENGRDGGRISVRLMFSNSMLDDYRIALARRR